MEGTMLLVSVPGTSRFAGLASLTSISNHLLQLEFAKVFQSRNNGCHLLFLHVVP
jgi:hypothetical protein